MMSRGYANLNAFVENDKHERWSNNREGGGTHKESKRINLVEHKRKDSHLSNEKFQKHGLVPGELRSQASTNDQYHLLRRGSRGGEHHGEQKSNRKGDPKVHSKTHKSSHHRHNKDTHRHHRRDSHRHHHHQHHRHHHHHQKEVDAKESSSGGLLWSCVKSVCSSFASVVRKNIFTNENNTSENGRGKTISDLSRLIDKNAQRKKEKDLLQDDHSTTPLSKNHNPVQRRDGRKKGGVLEQDNNLQNRNGEGIPRRNKKIKNASYEFSDNDLKNLFMLEGEERGDIHTQEDAKRLYSGDGRDGKGERVELSREIVKKNDGVAEKVGEGASLRGEASAKGEEHVKEEEFMAGPPTIPNIMINNGSFSKNSQRDDLNTRGRGVTLSSEEENTLGRLGGLKPGVLDPRKNREGEKEEGHRRKGSLPLSGRSNRTSRSSSDVDGGALRDGFYGKDNLLRKLLELEDDEDNNDNDDSDEYDEDGKAKGRQPAQSNKKNAPEQNGYIKHCQGKTFLQNGLHQIGEQMSSVQGENVEKLYYENIFEDSEKKGKSKSKSMDDPDDSDADSFKNIFYNRKMKKKKKKGKLTCMPQMEQTTNGADGVDKKSGSDAGELNTGDADISDDVSSVDGDSHTKDETHKRAHYFRNYIKSSEEIKQIRFEFKELIQTIDSFIVKNSTSDEINSSKNVAQRNDQNTETPNSHKRESKNEATYMEMDKMNEGADEGSADEQSMKFIDGITSEDKSGYVILKNDEESLIEALEKLRIEKRKKEEREKDGKVRESDDEANRIRKADAVASLDPDIFFKCINKNHYEKAAQILRQKGENGVLIDKFNVPLLYSQIKCLMDTRWLNDEVINFYMSMLQEYNTKNIKKDTANNFLPKIFTFSTFFFQSLNSNGTYSYNKVSRWTKRKKVDIFSFDLILIPLHVGGNHWTLGSINMREKKIKLYDSLNMSNTKFFEYMRRYLVDEMRDKKQMELDVSVWEYNPEGCSEEGIPCQENGYDCGVFTCMFAKCLSFNRSFDFSQRDIKEIRMKMVYEISQGCLIF
ncbi:sentrin-specific protease 1, putative [Plasmodium knowlesi strain H]|uniref:Sentrin-specific protease 1, putative n=3 Tax=Plasmodium knowlesi TaxID=5850 RepID=A0A5K1V6T0_PLAKH|nr:sentrin-specific protease 1, putative [Plasmodium knowlesi strain H]OTN64010.1 putative Peptidase [Plasmodium knowlesi]CAA9991129.1 sentrin-specific protease 1, putative [Plasmodium knowlesi strain H]SBO20557.1 sentrin-specific protease 1, putative [Plasmodium knowlesi strain H]SBO20941.1 sentrin-specific protease 1, putative [Plasmodium knowlesi strain H]VVS80603.1 sentrin-specific protease 1, putative [Plasmodium knowlesi strain H]|eukprot:XP_002262413.1 peptidase, putative [Plasmodium knowlesi strain H]